MLDIKNLTSSLPSYPAYRGQWTSLYLEPMMASGERFTVAVAARGSDGAFKVHPAMRPHVIDAMFGAKSEAFNKLIELACSSLSHHLSCHGTFDGWAMPITGLTMGRIRDTVSSDLTGLLKQAVCMTASLAALDFDIEKDNSRALQPDTVDRWPTQFKDAVLARNPKLSGYFNKSFSISELARPAKIFYLSDQVAINTGRLEPGSRLQQLLNHNKAGLIDLASIQGAPNSLIAVKHLELVVFRPSLSSPLYSNSQIDFLREALHALSLLGKQHELIVTEVETAEQAADRLFTAEAA